MPRPLELDLSAAGGLATTARLRTAGHRETAISAAVRRGAAHRPRRGWLAGHDAPQDAVRAVARGGRLGAGSALSSHGLWVDDDDGIIIVCAPTASRLPPLQVGEVRIWVTDQFPTRSRIEWRVSVMDALLQFGRAHPRESVVASIDSALHHGMIGADNVARLCDRMPRRLRGIHRDVDGRAMSGTESHMRMLLAAEGLRLEPQAHIPGVGFVDLLVNGWLIVELDSAQHHGSGSQQSMDRRRDGQSVLAGYAHERFTWLQVKASPGWCVEVVLARLRDGRPDRPGDPGRRRTTGWVRSSRPDRPVEGR